MKHKVDFLKDDVFRLFLRYLGPSIAATAVASMYILFDTIFIGRGVGSDGLAALNIALPVYNVIFALGLLAGVGGATVMAISMGQKRLDMVNKIFTQSMIVAIVFGTLTAVLGSVFIDELCMFLGATESNFKLVKDYLSVIMMFSFSFLISNALSVFIRNDKAPKLAMWATVIGTIINIILDWLFVMVFHLGMRGAAIATITASLIGLFILVYFHFIRGKGSLRFVKTKVQGSTLKRILKNGVPSFIIEISSGVVIFAFNMVLDKITGTIGISAYSIIANISLMCGAIFTGICQASQPIISVNYGAREMKRVNKVLKLGVTFAFAFGVMFFLVGMLFPRQIVSLFNKDSLELMEITSKGIQLYFIAFIIMGVNIVMGSYFQAIEYSMLATVVSLGRGVVFILLGLFILPNMLGVSGVWLTVPFAEVLSLGITLIFFSKLKKNLSMKQETKIPNVV